MSGNQEMVVLFKQLSDKEGIATVFHDFVKLGAISISNTVDGAQFDTREQEYLRIVEKYTTQELNVFTELLAILVLELEKEMRDVLGELYMALEIQNTNTAQFFTPWHIARLMAEVSVSEAEEDIITLADPCIGAGVTIIAQAAVLRDQGINYQEKLRVYGSDIDRNVLLMSYLQLSLLGIDAVCERKDALTNEDGELWFTPFHMLHNVMSS